MFPLPLGRAQLEPAEAVQVQVALFNVAGKTSVTVAPVTAIGPLLVTTIVYVVARPGVTFAALLVLVIVRSVEDSVSVSVAELFAAFVSTDPGGTAILAEFVREPVAVAATVAVKVYVAVPFTAKLTVVLILPVPLADPQLEPDDAVQVQEALVNVAGKLSATAAPVTALGPELLTVIV